MIDFLSEQSIYNVLKILLDFSIVTYIVYNVLKFTSKTKIMTLLKGITVIFLTWLISKVLGLTVLSFLLEQTLVYGFFTIIIIFHPELRAGLEKLGKHDVLLNKLINLNLFNKNITTIDSHLNSKEIDNLVESVYYMSNRKIGALISIEISDSLEDYIKTGIGINALISKELLINIFTPNVPLHDGALIIRDGRIESGSCYLPLSQSSEISKELGTRHRAGIGLSEVSDALTLIVSEETGNVSITRNSKLYRGLEKDEFKRLLEMVLLSDDFVKVNDLNNLNN